MIDPVDLEQIKGHAEFTVEAVKEREKVTDHDVAAFVDVISSAVPGDAGRWLHYGLTSSDVLDTALALQLKQAGRVIDDGAADADRRAGRSRARVPRHALRRPHARRPRRADDLRPAPGGLRLRGPPLARAAGRRLRAGRGRQALRRGRHLLGARARGRARGARKARPEQRAGRDPGDPARPPRGAAVGDRAGRRFARAARDGDSSPAAHRGARGPGAVPRGPEGLQRDAAQAQPDRLGAHHRAGARAARQRPGRARERRALARARHLALVGRAHRAARLDRRCSTTCSRWRCA